jgi:ATP-dependent protease Clp ATPase subunit
MEETYGVNLNLSDDEIKQIARKASQNRMGIRNLRSMIKMRCNDRIYENNG